MPGWKENSGVGHGADPTLCMRLSMADALQWDGMDICAICRRFCDGFARGCDFRLFLVVFTGILRKCLQITVTS